MILDKIIKIFNYAFIKVFSLFPVKKNTIVFHSVPDFSDNAWAFYRYLITNNFNEALKIVWLVKDPKKYKYEKNVKFVSNKPKVFWIKRDYYLATSGYVIFTHTTPIRTWRKNQLFIHTKHSASQLKAAMGNGEKKKNRKDADIQLICGHDGFQRNLEGHGYSENSMLKIGMPRLDLLFDHKDCVSLLFNKAITSKVIIAMETFKQHKSWNDSSKNTSYGLNIFSSEEELVELDRYLSKNGFILLIKPHPLQLLDKIYSLALENIKLITDDTLREKDIQLYELLENADALITDYSSVYYDYLLLNRPIGFTIGDIEEYKRGFIIDNPLEEMTGEKIRNLKELEIFINHLVTNEDNYAEERKALIKQVFDYPDNKNCERLYSFLLANGLEK